MNEDYLWDKSGPPDPEIQRLEQQLSRFGSRRERRGWSRAWRPAAAVLLVLGLAAGGVRLLQGSNEGPARPETRRDYEVAVLEGSVHIEGRPMVRPSPVLEGTVVETDADGVARVTSRGVGRLTLRGGTRVRLEAFESDQHRWFLERGKLDVFVEVGVPARFFRMGTSAGTVVDLGCAYTMEASEADRTVIEVTGGCVAFESRGRVVWVPRGFRVVAYDANTLGTPVAVSASPEFAKMLSVWDLSRNSKLAVGVQKLLAVARAEDLLSLWHLIEATAADERALVVDAMLRLRPPPLLVVRAQVLELEPWTMETWRKNLTGGW